MSDTILIRSWVRGSDEDLRAGLLGYVSVFVGNLVIDSITVRRTADGWIVLSFPARTDRFGRRHAIVRPEDDAARQAIEREILDQLREQGESTS